MLPALMLDGAECYARKQVLVEMPGRDNFVTRRINNHQFHLRLCSLVYAAVQGGRRRDIYGAPSVACTRLDALLRNFIVRHPRCRAICIAG